MNDETLENIGIEQGAAEAVAARQARGTSRAGEESMLENAKRIVIASSFTADLLRNPLAFWMQALDVDAEIVFAPYAQVMQELLSPVSAVSQNKAGFNVLLMRFEDWIRDRAGGSVSSNIEHVQGLAREFIQAIRVSRSNTTAPMFLFLCPTSSALQSAYAAVLEDVRNDVVAQLQTLTGVHCWNHSDLIRLYPVADYEDDRSDQIAHIPYTGEYFVALATLLARRIAVTTQSKFKVIAIDCDNTLWKGICGEDGVEGLELTPAHLDFQRALVRQHDAGMLLCLCSKNNWSDVEAVFKEHSDMPLRERHFSGMRVNWSQKSENLRALSRELDLSLDSFIFIDDSALECAEVKGQCPEVLALQMPAEQGEIRHFVDHVWAFDRIGVTEEAKQRTELYLQNRRRREALEKSGNIEQFLATLKLEVDVTSMRGEELTRVAELIQRTNQFNLTSIRRRIGEIETLWRSGALRSLVVHVRDRFGDYGLVGAILLRSNPSAIEVDTFVLSCRVLGRGVEHRIVKELAQLAVSEQLSSVILRLRRTSKNAPASDFVHKAFGQFRAEAAVEGGVSSVSEFAVPVGYVLSLQHRAEGIEKEDSDISAPNDAKVRPAVPSYRWHEVGYRLSRLGDLVSEISRSAPIREYADSGYVAPRTPVEAAVAEMWSEVLGLDHVSVRADFLDLGGDSLLAVQVIARLASALGLELSIYDFFEQPTVEAIASKAQASAEPDFAVERIDRGQVLAMSSGQRRLWFIDQLDGNSRAYHISVCIRCRGELDRTVLQGALDALIERHESLRTVFTTVDGRPVQKIAQSGSSFMLRSEDLRGLSWDERNVEMRRNSQAELTERFDLRTGPLVRGRLLQLASDEYVVYMTMHHIISDGWSIGVLMKDLAALYHTRRSREVASLTPLRIQYADYAHWQNRLLEAEGNQRSLTYWKEQLDRAPALLELPTDRSRPPAQSYVGASVLVAMGSELTREVRELAKRSDLTLAMTLYTAWAVVLSRLSGQDDVVIGVPVANRPHIEFEGIVGFFVNTLAIRLRLDDDPSVVELLQRAKSVMLGAYAHQDVPFERVVEAVQPTRSLSHSPIFQVMFVLQNTPPGSANLPGLTMEEELVPLEAAQFDLTLTLHESENGIAGHVNYATDLFDATTIERWIQHLKSVLWAFVRDPQLQASRLPLLGAEERRQLIETFNPVTRRMSVSASERLLHELFEAQVVRSPESIAVTYEGQSLTYGELNSRANQLAWHLRRVGVERDQLVPVCVHRGFELVVALLGILKAGGAYVPLDPDYPPERLAFMLNDAAPRVLITQGRLRSSLPDTAAAVIALDDDWSEIAKDPASNVDPKPVGASPAQLAYVIYTSGSTGKPKGVMVEHRNVTRLFSSTDGWFKFNEQDVWTLFHSYAFDFSVWELWGALLYGGKVVVVPHAIARSAPEFYRLICDEGVTILNQTPSAFSQVIDAQGRSPNQKHRLREVIFGGEALDLHTLRPWVERNGATQPRLVNMYGITETTVHVTYRPLTASEIQSDRRSPVGRAIPDLQAYILDRHRQPVPIGVTGELYISGAGVARGYLNRTALTAERFICDPFHSDPKIRMYKTGDLGRWRPDGSIDYLGRNDHQVKIRGFRIELGEIEARLTQHRQVRDAVVIAREDAPGGKSLVAYVVLDGSSDAGVLPSVEELRAHVKAAMPEYMVPSAIVVLARMPLTSNGKLDRGTLPKPDFGAVASRHYEAPQGEVEETLAQVWKGLLRAERVGRRDNFFELGGHSLLIVQMMDHLRHAGLMTEVRRVFECASLADLAAALNRDGSGEFEVPPNLIPLGCETITPEMLTLLELDGEHIQRIVRSVPGGAANIQDIYPLAPLQEGIHFHHLLNDQGGDVYVLPTLLTVASRTQAEEIAAALQHVIDRHDILRTAVLWEQLPNPVQVVYRKATLPVIEVALDPSRSSAEQVEEWIKPERQRIDIRRAPPMRLQIAANERAGHWYVMLQLHHITVDHLTSEVLISEALAHLDARDVQLPESAPYRNHVAQALAYARRHDAVAFFRGKLGDMDEPTAPFGLSDVYGDGRSITEAIEPFDSALARRVRMQARACGVSPATLFHAAWALVIAETSVRDDVVFGSVLLGRLQGSAGAQRILGMFINTLPLRIRLRGVTARELVEQAHRELIELLTHEQASLATAQRCSGMAPSSPLFTTLFNYRHSAINPDAQWSSVTGIRVLAIQERTNYPITLSVDDFGEEFQITAQTDRHIDPHRLIDCLRTAVQSLVTSLEAAPLTSAAALSILSQGERRQVTERFNATSASYPVDLVVHRLFEEQVQRTPNRIAAVFGGRPVTYSELNQRANRLARHLRSKGIVSDQLVGICIDRHMDLLIGLLGVLKAGGAYLPLDVNYPIPRLRHMLVDAQPKIVLTRSHLRAVVSPVTSAELIELDTVDAELDQYSDVNIPWENSEPTTLSAVYVIYTSGSTGMPKGTVMSHRSMVNLIEWHRRNLPISEEQRVLQFAAISFDVAFQEIFSTLCTGGTLVLVDEWVRKDARELTAFLNDLSIERLFVPPLMLQSLSDYSKASGEFPRKLRDVITAGEQLRISPEIAEFFARLDGCRLHNHYGPTESHVVTALTLEGSSGEWPVLPTIGRPILNSRIYILNKLREPTAVGVTGEIYIGGENVARCYLNRAELTAERFICDPFSTAPRSRLYKTGDLGCWQADGSIQYLGRNDEQVKIRGHRIELGEIEAQLGKHSQVMEAAVIAREDIPGVRRLVAYVTPRHGNALDLDVLRAYVKSVLPEHMLPGAFVVLDRLPLTPSGKLARRSLPVPEQSAYSVQHYEPPEGEIEAAIARVWQELLHVDRVGRYDNFFELGGHSILAVKTLFKINELCGASIKVTDIYAGPTVKELGTRIGVEAIRDERVDLLKEAVLDAAVIARSGSPREPVRAILLTGATGFVGRFLLAQLLEDTQATIYCLVRATSQHHASVRIRETLEKWDLWRGDSESRIVAIPGDQRLAHLGLNDDTYKVISEEVDEIYHCATSMNHLETYEMAKAANVESAREIIKLATNGRVKVINYVSTLGVFSLSAGESMRVVNELTSIDKEVHRNSGGHMASKWVADKIFMTAMQKGIPCNIFRIGLMWADSQKGRFDESQHVYRTIKSCLLAGCGIEHFRYPIPPTPIDYTVRAISHLASRHRFGGEIFHISSSKQTELGIFELCNETQGISLDLLSHYEWIRQMERLHQIGKALPIVPLIEFAFGMSEDAFDRHHFENLSMSSIRFDFSRTHEELERAGIVAPVLDDKLISLCVEAMFARDPDLKEMVGNQDEWGASGRGATVAISRTRDPHSLVGS